MKKSLIVTLLVIILVIVGIYIVTKLPALRLSDKERCEKSGGVWQVNWTDEEPDSFDKYYCHCLAESDLKTDKWIYKWKLEKNSECVECKTDSECRYLMCTDLHKPKCPLIKCDRVGELGCAYTSNKCTDGLCIVTMEEGECTDECVPK